MHQRNWWQATVPGEVWCAVRIGCRGSVGQSELRAAALCKTVWWDLHLACLLTHLFACLFACLFVCTVMDFSAAEIDSGMKLRIACPCSPVV